MTRKKVPNKPNLNNNSSVPKATFIKPVKNDSNSLQKSSFGIKGLVNLGNTCYFNSMLQMFLNIPGFFNQLKSYCTTEHNIVARLPDKEYELVLKTTDVSLVERELLVIWESDKDSLSPASLRSALLQHKDFKTHFNGFNEQDSHEVFLMVLNIIKEAQIKRIRGAVLDSFDCRKASHLIDDSTKKRINEISSTVDKQSLVNNMFGIVIGSNLKCQSCGEMRMRFDEVFHITPIFPRHDSTGAEEPALTKKTDPETVFIKPKNQTTAAPEKTSKHQLKRQKRFEKKAARNKKSMLRNNECSPEEMTVNGQIISNEKENEKENENEMEDNVEDEEAECPIVIGGHDDYNMDEDIVMQQLIFDAVALESQMNRKSSSHCSSTNDSMVALKNDSSRISINSLTSSIDLDICVEDDICNQLIRDMSVQGRNTEKEEEKEEEEEEEENLDKKEGTEKENEEGKEKKEEEGEEDNNGTMEDMSTYSTELADEDSDVDKMSSAGNVIRADVNKSPRTDVCFMEEKEEFCSQKSISIVDSRTGDRNKQFLQSAFSATLDTHQDYLSRNCHNKIVYDAKTDLDRALDRFTTPLFLENIVCETCSGPKQKVQTDHLKTDVICHLPQVLPFYISRFKQSAARNRTKNTEVYSYPFILNLSSQCSKYANFSSNGAPVLYRLFGIIEHIGLRINTGHYVSYICRPLEPVPTSPATTTTFSTLYPANMLGDISRKHGADRSEDFDWFIDKDSADSVPSDEPSQYQWFRVSDSHVESISKDSVMHIQAFMLFYSRIQ